MSTQDLPTRFPCWVKAVYSWGGETKRDLGFIEGDLIECLNAGDGSWWTGRLRRDKRMVGLFPSNFVQVLDMDYQPSPRPTTRDSGSLSRPGSPHIPSPITSSPQKSKSVFRKPFTAYAAAGAPNPSAAARDLHCPSPGATPSPAGSVSKASRHRPYASMKKLQNPSPIISTGPYRPPSPTIPAPIARASSPLPPVDFSRSISRAASPLGQHVSSRAPSPAYREDFASSSPPPPPPAHRVAYNRQSNPGAVDYTAYNTGYHTPRTHSSTPYDQHSGLTPSPLRDAMNEVMTSLDGMSLSRSNSRVGNTHLDIWSPEAFNEIYSESVRRTRSNKSMRYAGQEEEDDEEIRIKQHSSYFGSGNCTSPQMDELTHRMENHSAHYTSEQHGRTDLPPAPPPKGVHAFTKPRTPYSNHEAEPTFLKKSEASRSYNTGVEVRNWDDTRPQLRTRKSAYELGKEKLHRTFTTRSSVTTASSIAQSTSTNNSNSTQITSQSLMSGYSAGGFSATSAGSLARRQLGRSASAKGRPPSATETHRPATSMSGVSYHSSHASSNNNMSHAGCEPFDRSHPLNGFLAPTEKKRSFFKKMLDTAKTSAATARTKGPLSRPSSRGTGTASFSITGIEGGISVPGGAKDMELGNGVDWVQMRRDVNRSNSLCRNEKNERAERSQMMDFLVMRPVDLLEDAEGDEGDGVAVQKSTDFNACNLALVDKNARFISNLPALVNPISLAQNYLCRPYRSDIQRLRAIFTWVAERIAWEEEFEGDIDTRRLLQTKRGCSEEIALLVAEMCAAAGVHAEVVQGYLKPPGVPLMQDMSSVSNRPNHWWNAVFIEGEWRIMDCSLAGPTNPHRSAYSSVGNQVADGWWFLARPMEICYTHVPLIPEQQHIIPPMSHDVLMALPVAGPACFKHDVRMWDFDTSLLQLDGLEMAHIQLSVPDDVECTAEVEARAFARDADGDFFESGDVVRKRALAQGEFVSCGGDGAFKRYTIKALLPSSSDTASLSNTATLKIYAGRRGLMHSLNNNPHAFALALPLSHQGVNPEYVFFTRHPTPHALRHELYVTGPLCRRLVCNSTFVFGVRQHPASTTIQSITDGHSTNSNAGHFVSRPTSALSTGRPTSALSMASMSASGSAYSNPSATGSDSAVLQQHKPAKLAIQSPSGKIMRMTRKVEQRSRLEAQEEGVVRVGTLWESIIKIGERGVWRGLVLADRSARWCVFGEWECV